MAKLIFLFPAIEMKKYWADVLEQEEPGTVLTSSEPSLKIKILDDVSI